MGNGKCEICWERNVGTSTYIRNVGTSKTVGTGKNVPLRIIWLNSKGTYLPSSTLGEMKWMINAEKIKMKVHILLWWFK